MIFVVCASVRDGCGRGNSLKLLLLGPQRVERDERHAIVGACHRTSNGQEHKIICRAELERDTIFHLRVRACRGRGSHRQDERLAWVASRGQGTSCSSSFVSKVLGANYKRANNFLPVAHKSPCALTESNLGTYRYCACACGLDTCTVLIMIIIRIYTDQLSYSHGKGY